MWILTAFLLLGSSPAALGGEVKMQRSTYAPVFRDPGEKDSVVGPLWVGETPVTNREFLEFLKKHPQYMRSKVASLFADRGYLRHWKNDSSYAQDEAHYPVTWVSWFIARKYCEAENMRLPTIAEWEVLSDAQNSKYEPQILQWYGKPDAGLRNVNREPANKFGVKGAHGLIWEWVDNFSETIMSGDSRGGSSTESMFCGGASLKAKDPRLYATFMRFAFRSSLTAKYTSANLGFRCVRDIKGGAQ